MRQGQRRLGSRRVDEDLGCSATRCAIRARASDYSVARSYGAWLGAVSSSGPIAAPGSAVRSGGLAGTAGAHISNGMARYEVLIRSGSGLSIDG